jgi:DNA recombination protein RmuC
MENAAELRRGGKALEAAAKCGGMREETLQWSGLEALYEPGGCHLMDLLIPGIAVLIALLVGVAIGWSVARARAAEAAAGIQAENARLKTEIVHRDTVVPEKLQLIKQLQDQLRDSFQALADAALRNSTDQFLKLADQKIGNVHREATAELSRRQQALDELVAPIRDTLTRVTATLADVDRHRVEDTAAIGSTLRGVQEAHLKLEREAQNLVRALRTPSIRGRWGEMQLRRVVEMAGMEAFSDFEEQPTLLGENGRQRPDLIVKLPGGRTVVVDAKVPLDAFLNAQDGALEDATRASHMADHARQVRDHMTKLGGKAYWEQFHPSPEFVVMFLPGEAVFQAALQEDAALIEFGVQARVFPASPITLIALLRAVAHGWRQERIAENAAEISLLGKELYNRLAPMVDYLDEMRKKLDGAVDAYNRLVGSFEGRVLVQARRFKDLGAATGADLPVLEQIDTKPRVPQTANLMALPEGAVVGNVAEQWEPPAGNGNGKPGNGNGGPHLHGQT